MSNKFLKFATLSLVVVAVLAATVAPALASTTEAGRKPPVPPTPVVTPLNEAEIAGLLFMREEEKLAHDVYVTLYAQWGAAVFNNITTSETAHMASVKTLLDRYGLIDPVTGNGVGEFENADLQALYTQLIAQGRQSLSAALKAGAAIEEIDILDLKARLATTTHGDIQQVYASLMNGSYNPSASVR